MLEVRNITAGYGELEVVHDFSMQLNDGEIACMVGPNGSGKSTILKSIVGIVKPRKGAILLDGKDLSGLEPCETLRSGICLSPQGMTAFSMMTVLENLLMGAYIVKDGNEIRERLEEAYNSFPVLGQRRGDTADKLSGGEQVMLCIARALMSHPKVILLDEPSLGLAPKVSDYLYARISEISRNGSSMIIVEQNVRKALSVAHRAYVIRSGRKRFEGKPEELSSDDRLKELFWGSMN